ncbi:hypothetical protein OAL85_00875 [Methylophilaceae bacterium]|nr:hypothetical protein [Methylophilaceae bacterium]
MIFNNYKTDIWAIGVVKMPIDKFIKTTEAPKIKWIFPKKNFTFLADPFGIWKDNKLYIFYEGFDYRFKKGRIDCTVLNKNFKEIESFIVLDESFHLSYPFIVEDNNSIYIIPESSRAEKTLIYKFKEFPRKLEPVGELIPNLGMVDPSLIKYQGKWWCFYSLFDKNDTANGDLHIAYSKNLLGPWKKHPKNPVIVDYGSSRMGGKPFLLRGDLHLPIQDSETTYGAKLKIIKVDLLNENNFKGSLIKIINPFFHKRYNQGIHTLSDTGSATLIDSKRIDTSPVRFWINMQRRLYRALGLT